MAYRNGQPVRLQELGRVMDSVQDDKVAAWFNGTRAHHPRRPTPARRKHRCRWWTTSARCCPPSARRCRPRSISVILYDRSQSIRESVHDVQFTLLLTVGLVVLVIFLFLRNLSATIIPSLALPMSIIGTFAVMYLLGYSVDNLSLMALTLSVGFVVDDAIVMLENIVRHMEHGEPPLTRPRCGARAKSASRSFP